MNCIFDSCEFYNLFLGGIITGIITSFLFVWLTNFLSRRKFKLQYKHLQSKSPNSFDWVAYSMRQDNSRLRQDNPNGSELNVQVSGSRIFLKLKHDNRLWIGELKVDGFDYGIVTYKYENQHEYGKRECVIGSYEENEATFDYLYLMPVNNKIYHIQKIDSENQKVIYDYGDEIFIRKR